MYTTYSNFTLAAC